MNNCHTVCMTRWFGKYAYLQTSLEFITKQTPAIRWTLVTFTDSRWEKDTWQYLYKHSVPTAWQVTTSDKYLPKCTNCGKATKSGEILLDPNYLRWQLSFCSLQRFTTWKVIRTFAGSKTGLRWVHYCADVKKYCDWNLTVQYCSEVKKYCDWNWTAQHCAEVKQYCDWNWTVQYCADVKKYCHLNWTVQYCADVKKYCDWNLTVQYCADVKKYCDRNLTVQYCAEVKRYCDWNWTVHYCAEVKKCCDWNLAG